MLGWSHDLPIWQPATGHAVREAGGNLPRPLPNSEPEFLSKWFSHQSPDDDLAAGIVEAGLLFLAGKAKIELLLGETLFECLEAFGIGLGLTRHGDSTFDERYFKNSRRRALQRTENGRAGRTRRRFATAPVVAGRATRKNTSVS